MSFRERLRGWELAKVAALASKLLGSSVLAQIAVLAATAYAASDLRPGDFALHGVVAGGSWLAVSFNTLSAEWRAPVVSRKQADSLIRVGGACVVIVSAVALLLGIGAFFINRSTGVVLWFIAACGLFLGMQQLLTAIVMRKQHQSLLARGRLVQGLSNAILIVCLLQVPIEGFVVLSLSWTVSLAAGVVSLFLGCRADVPSISPPHRREWKALVSEVRFQPLANVMAASVGAMPLMLLPVIAGNSLSGAWAITDRFLNPLVNTAYNTLQPIYYGQAAEYLRGRRLATFRELHFKWVFLLAGSGVLMLAFTAVVILSILPLFGDQWRVASIVVVPACFYYVSLFVCCPLQQTLLLLGEVRTQFQWTALRCGLCGGSLALASLIGPLAALTIWSISAAGTFYLHVFLQRWSVRPNS